MTGDSEEYGFLGCKTYSLVDVLRCSFGTPMNRLRTKRCYNPEDCTIQIFRSPMSSVGEKDRNIYTVSRIIITVLYRYGKKLKLQMSQNEMIYVPCFGSHFVHTELLLLTEYCFRQTVCMLHVLLLVIVETMTRRWQQYTAVRGACTSVCIPVSIFAEIRLSYIARNSDLKVSFKGCNV
jgi:hypothetical protein